VYAPPEWIHAPVGKTLLSGLPCQAGGIDCQENEMITLGIILLIIGFIAKIAVLWSIGIILLVIGLILVVLGAMGRAVGGRRHYY
jgi:hypothetical protein